MKACDRRKAILDSATHLFAERGFSGVTTRELAQAAGVSEPVLYQHFTTKRDLYSALINERCGEGFAKLSELINKAASECLNERDFFLRFAMLMVESTEKDPRFMRLVMYSSLDGHAQTDVGFATQVRQFYGLLTRYMEERMQSGRFRQSDPLLAARSLAGMIYQYCLFEVTLGFRIFAEDKNRTISTMVDIFLNGILQNEN